MLLLDIFLDPGKVFIALKERPTFLVPLLVFVAVLVASTLAYFLRVDPVWYADHVLAMAGTEMTTAEIAQAKQFMPSAPVQGYIGTAVAAIATPLLFALFAVYYLLAGKVAGAAVTFKHAMALSTWASMPTVLGIAVMLVGALLMAPQTAQNTLMLTNVDPLLVQLPYDSAFSGLAKGFSLITFWVIGLTALGWKTFTGSGWKSALLVAVLPTLVFYGGWLAFALLRA